MRKLLFRITEPLSVRASWYTCPILIHIQWALWPFKHRWHDGKLYREVWRDGRYSHGVQVRSWWPRWLILAEWRFHEWVRAGLRPARRDDK